MDNIIATLNDFNIYITAALIVMVIILLICVIVLFKSMNNLENRYRKFMRGVNNKNLEELVISYLDKIDAAKQQTDYMKELYKEMDKRIKGCVQKVAMVRYRAFDNVGSDLSFSIAMLDHNDDGFVLTSIYGRNESTTYAKPIDKGISRYELSEEENKVLQDAMSKKLGQ